MPMNARLLSRNVFPILALCAVLLLVAACRPQARPQLLPDETVATDLADLAAAAWDRFLEAFAGRADCFGDVILTTSKDLGSRAVYDPATATVTVEVPATAALLEAALIHEWAHHVEFHCPEHQGMRPGFLAAQSAPVDADWFSGSTWADIPSEQYAEAAVILVLGRRQLPTEAAVTPAAVEVLAQWAAGK
jgi:hypothetical protein